ncbi:LPS translocon maturation chaperone LptM [Pleionea litopenaei]
MNRYFIRTIQVIVLLALVGCGQKGPLKPAEDNQMEQQPLEISNAN